MQTIEDLIKENLKLRQKVKELESQLKTDSLTKVGSKAELLKVQNRREEITETLVLAFDIKDFGNYNKKYGHLVGDNFLVMFANELKDVFRISDNIYRFGGDEFVAILKISKNFDTFDKIKKRLDDYKISSVAYIGLARGTKSVSELLSLAFEEVEKQKLGVN